jgi:hypothetical protein
MTCWDVRVELRGFEPLTPCMPCHTRHLTWSSAALLRTASALLNKDKAPCCDVRARVGSLLTTC